MGFAPITPGGSVKPQLLWSSSATTMKAQTLTIDGLDAYSVFLFVVATDTAQSFIHSVIVSRDSGDISTSDSSINHRSVTFSTSNLNQVKIGAGYYIGTYNDKNGTDANSVNVIKKIYGLF